MSQEKYVGKFMNHFDMQECTTRETPCDQKVDYSVDASKMAEKMTERL